MNQPAAHLFVQQANLVIFSNKILCFASQLKINNYPLS